MFRRMRRRALAWGLCGLLACGGSAGNDDPPAGDAAPGVRVGTGSPALDFDGGGGTGPGPDAALSPDARPAADGPGAGPDLVAADVAPDAPDPAAWREPCDRFAQFFCKRFGECAPLFLGSEYGDEGTCRERTVTLCQMAALAPGATLKAEEVQRCSEEHIGTIGCEQLLTNGSLDVCIPGGSHPLGATCYVGTQCQTGLCLLGAQGCGVCARRAGPGERCLVDGHCRAGLVCPTATLACTRPAALGEACLEPGQPCRMPLRCVGGTCAVPREEGGACMTHEGCNVLTQLLCTDGGVLRLGRCSRFELPRPGESCDSAMGQVPVCLAGTCGKDKRICLGRARDGEPCGAAADGRDCFEPAGCFAGVCRVPACPGTP